MLDSGVILSGKIGCLSLSGIRELESCVSYSETKTDLVSLSLRKRRIAITGNSLECKYCNFKINS